MLLCDIGNTSYHFLDERRSYKENVKSFKPQVIKETVYFICVNSKAQDELKNLDNWIDLAPYIDRSKYYETMGIDRIVALEAVSHGVIIDAGSAITVDVVRDDKFMGGFIYPGVNAMHETYKNISDALDYEFNFDLDLKHLPKDSQNAISYGFLKILYSEIASYKMPILLTGGDAKLFGRLFKEAKIDEALIFRGMKKIISKI